MLKLPLAHRVNDGLSEAARTHPDRFAAFAALPTADPKAAADELERTVVRLGFKGATAANLSVTPFASTFISLPAGSFPIRLCCAA